jgi:hypothetical protein
MGRRSPGGTPTPAKTSLPDLAYAGAVAEIVSVNQLQRDRRAIDGFSVRGP